MSVISKKILIKVGSNVLTLPTGAPNKERIKDIASQIAKIKEEGAQVILVSSGAVAAGRSIVTLPENLDLISKKQVYASVGQIALMNIYNDFFKDHNLTCSQVLITKDSFSTRDHYLNVTNLINALLKSDIIPIVNENDAIAITELMFTDNDEISGLLATMSQVDELLLLSNVDGIYTDHPSNPEAKLIREYKEESINLENAISDQKSEFGRGGMLTKANTAIKIAEMGVNVSIGNGNTPDIVSKLLAKKTGTFFKAKTDNQTSSVKKWITNSGSYSKGKVFINKGAYQALLDNQAASLLPIGVEKVEGNFEKGDIITIVDENGIEIGLGKAAYDAQKAIEYKLQQNQPAVIHYNYLTIK